LLYHLPRDSFATTTTTTGAKSLFYVPLGRDIQEQDSRKNKVPMPVPPGSGTAQVIREGRTVRKFVPADVMGLPYFTTSLPILEEGTVVGVPVVIKPVEIETRMDDLSRGNGFPRVRDDEVIDPTPHGQPCLWPFMGPWQQMAGAWASCPARAKSQSCFGAAGTRDGPARGGNDKPRVRQW